jgi:hypothetical protein
MCCKNIKDLAGICLLRDVRRSFSASGGKADFPIWEWVRKRRAGPSSARIDLARDDKFRTPAGAAKMAALRKAMHLQRLPA